MPSQSRKNYPQQTLDLQTYDRTTIEIYRITMIHMDAHRLPMPLLS
jgi:hypothetical protein